MAEGSDMTANASAEAEKAAARIKAGGLAANILSL